MAKKDSTDVFMTELDAYLFGEGTHYEIYNKMGAHKAVKDGQEGVYFAVWAPHAKDIFVVGDFNDWKAYGYDMKPVSDGGIYELFIPGAKAGQMYKFLIVTPQGEAIYKADPYANEAQLRPDNASIITDLTGFHWTDKSWVEKKKKENHLESPMAIYECHLGSWKKKEDGTKDGFMNYREIAPELADYVKDMGYTHVELMGIAEYPFDGSWGYQVTGYYAPTKRYGTPKDFMYFVDYMHSKGIGVILDWVPAHFPKDAHGLAMFDGTPLYEYADTRKGEHPDWGTKIFDYSKTEVVNFLIANALFWVEKYHADGIRMDAVASMLYLDYGKQDGEWIPNMYGGNENLEAIELIKHFNSILKKRDPGVLSIAEESTAFPMITGSLDEGGLGFDLKWNMGFMNDYLDYIKYDPYFRSHHHGELTFSMIYAYSEKFMLVFSHDEVVHGKGTLLGKMPGDRAQKLANLRLTYGYMMTHPGKKLLFMGQDFGQEREWSEERELDWYLLGEKLNQGVHTYVKELLELYRKYPAMYEIDNTWDGFEWMNADDAEHSTYCFVRKCSSSKNNLLFVLNMTPMKWENYIVPVPKKKKYKLLLNSDEERFGGWGNEIPAEIMAEKKPYHYKDYSISFDLPPYGAAVFLF